ncbi:LytTR family DNA-binding domain-containing protein [Azospirillum halopraeferens]|uniref:LytTR family DNA-binding domain-containing protein n=1 Tax=Azospirillum halopraeferens TaxID=34010 RepID=UPI000403A2BB|nr:LytTR family DNA-binding domain-containing protein [Azospirillum halopraeferens]
MRERQARILTRHLPILLVTVAVMTVIGPFGTFAELSVGQRLAYWGGLMGCGFALFHATGAAAVRIAARRGVGWPAAVAGLVAANAAVMTGAVALVERELRGHDFLSPSGLAELYAYVLVITLLVSAAPLWLELRAHGLLAGTGPAEPSAPPPARPPAFLDRIPPRLGRELLALEMEDHYVRVHTPLGSDLILMRLRDAVAELDGADGLQVHRSHWVAARAVTAVERRGDGRLILVLSTGRRVPVSRRYAAAVRGAGWIERGGHI